jgi:hypothetical protein
MSHLNAMKTTMRDKEMLIRALCKHMKINRNQIEVHDKVTRIYGYHSEEIFQGNVIVRKEHTGIPSDIGWELKGDSFVGHVDAYDYQRGKVYDPAWSMGLQQVYNHEVMKQGLTNKGIAYTESTSKDGYPVLAYHPQTQAKSNAYSM